MQTSYFSINSSEFGAMASANMPPPTRSAPSSALTQDELGFQDCQSCKWIGAAGCFGLGSYLIYQAYTLKDMIARKAEAGVEVKLLKKMMRRKWGLQYLGASAYTPYVKLPGYYCSTPNLDISVSLYMAVARVYYFPPFRVQQPSSTLPPSMQKWDYENLAYEGREKLVDDVVPTTSNNVESVSKDRPSRY
jgi:hypothetical protein